MEGADQTILRWAAVVFAGGLVIHNLDHARRGLSEISEHVVWGGTIVAMVAAVVLTLIFARHRLAPFVAAAAGFGITVGVSATHLLPHWSAFSDSLPDGSVDGITWAAVLVELAGAAWLGLAGISVLRRQGFAARDYQSVGA